MYVTIDLTAMRFVHAHPDSRACSALADIELSHVPVRVLGADGPDAFSGFTDLELRTLYHTATGTELPGYYRPRNLLLVHAVAASLPPADVNVAELMAARDQITDDSEGRFKYVKGHPLPVPQSELWEPDAPRIAPVTVAPTAAAAPVAGPTAAPAIPVATKAPPAPRKPASAPAGPAARPAAGTSTGRVWEIADTLRAQHTGDDKSLRKAVVAQCTAAGINPSTASVQYGKWLASSASKEA